MATYLATYEAQRRVVAHEYKALAAWQEALWHALLLACQSPGIPIDDPLMQAQLQDLWGTKSHTYRRLVGLEHV